MRSACAAEEISAAGDSVTIRMHVFDAALVVRADGKDKLKGTWVKYDAKTPYRVLLTASKNDTGQKFLGYSSETEKIAPPTEKSLYSKQGALFKTEFRDESGASYPAVGILRYEKSGDVVGTFLTTTGDYRYLSGNLLLSKAGHKLALSTFDGSHAFLFESILDNDNLTQLKGDYYSRQVGPRNLDGHS